MPCDMMGEATSGDFALSDVRRLEKRVLELEQALCGAIKTLEAHGVVTFDGNLEAWWLRHQQRPGHEK